MSAVVKEWVRNFKLLCLTSFLIALTFTGLAVALRSNKKCSFVTTAHGGTASLRSPRRSFRSFTEETLASLVVACYAHKKAIASPNFQSNIYPPPCADIKTTTIMDPPSAHLTKKTTTDDDNELDLEVGAPVKAKKKTKTTTGKKKKKDSFVDVPLHQDVSETEASSDDRAKTVVLSSSEDPFTKRTGKALIWRDVQMSLVSAALA